MVKSKGIWHGRISFSARHLILACHSGKFDVVHGAECPPVGLRVEIVFAEESYQFGAIKENATVCFPIIHRVTVYYVDLLSIKWQQ